MKTNELTGHALNFVVSQLEGADHDTAILNITVGDDNGWKLDYLTWEQAGPIIEREKIKVAPNLNDTWLGQIRHEKDHPRVAHKVLAGWTNQHGPTPLIAAMRCYVASRLGDEVEIPAELS